MFFLARNFVFALLCTLKNLKTLFKKLRFPALVTHIGL